MESKSENENDLILLELQNAAESSGISKAELLDACLYKRILEGRWDNGRFYIRRQDLERFAGRVLFGLDKKEETIEEGTVEGGTVEGGTVEGGTVEEGTVEGGTVGSKATEGNTETQTSPKRGRNE